jgi:hypothetical protein
MERQQTEDLLKERQQIIEAMEEEEEEAKRQAVSGTHNVFKNGNSRRITRCKCCDKSCQATKA